MTTRTITCEHCDSEIDVEKDPKCVNYDPSGATDVMCADCRERAYQRYGIGPCITNDLPIVRADNERARLRNIENERAYRIKRGWRA